MKLLGIHHITAIATDPQRNLDFYTSILGLRFVKRTVNFDDPATYHFYFGDRTGRPGTIMTFFPWPGAGHGTRGSGQVTVVGFNVPAGALEFWAARLKREGVVAEERDGSFGHRSLRFVDPDGLLLELIASAGSTDADVDFQSDVPHQFAIRGFNTPTLEVQRTGQTEELLSEFGFTLLGVEGHRRRLALNPTSPGARLDLLERADSPFGHISAGTVHHIAFRCANEQEQLHWRDKITGWGLSVTPVIDRQYFRSIYFREPGGILFEIATDGPGFTIDESVEELGNGLALPQQFESRRKSIQGVLPSIKIRPLGVA